MKGNARTPSTVRSPVPRVVRFGATLAMLAFLLVPVLTQAAATPNAIVGLVRIAPTSQTHVVGTQAQFTVWVSTAIGIPLANASVVLEVTGANNLTTTAVTTNSLGMAMVSYTGTHAGDDNVVATATSGSSSNGSNQATVHWNPAAGFSLSVSPVTKTLEVNNDVTITATLKDGAGNPIQDKIVQFKVTGANPVGNTDKTTDATGQATFTYTGNVAGDDTVFAFYDINGDHDQDAGEPGASANITWIAYTLTLSTSGATAAVNSTQSITATLKDTEGNAISGIAVLFTVTGVNPTTGTKTTDGNGQAIFTYTGTHAGVDTIKAWADVNKDSTQNNNDPNATTTITWSTSSLTLSPVNPTAPIGSSQTITATVKGANNAVLANVTVRFKVTGVNPTTGSKTTDNNGQAAFSYTGTHVGVDTVTVYADIDNDNAQDNGEPGASTTVTWTGANLTLSPVNVSAPVTTSQTFTATVKNSAGTALSNVKVRFVVTGANPNTGSATTDANGKASYSYTSNHAGTDTVLAYADFDNDGVQDATDPGASTTVTWTAASLILSLSNATAQVGTTQTVTATLKNANSQAISGIKIYFSVMGANPTAVNAVTNASGQASFSYTGTKAGTDTIHAYADLDSDGVQDGVDPASNVTLNWTTTPAPPAVRPSSPASPKAGCTFFPQTQHNLCAGFSAYWNQFGGLAIYGYPITEEFQENGMTVQYFERARFEWHPGAWPERYDVLLGLLGNQLTAGRTGTAFQHTAASSGNDCAYFAVTGHNVCGPFRAYWNDFGGLAIFGYPISEPFTENGVTVQYFERSRFELHPNAWPERHNVLLGRVGAEALAMTPY